MTSLVNHDRAPHQHAGTPQRHDPNSAAIAAQAASADSAAAAIDAAAEEAYWRRNHAARPYIKEGSSYDFYRPAYRLGWEARERHAGKAWDDVRDTLGQVWSADPANFEMPWEHAEPAVRDAWEHVGMAYPERFTTR